MKITEKEFKDLEMKRRANESLSKAAIESKDKIEDSNVFMQLFSDGIERDPVACMQLGMAIMLDKPIYVIAPEGAKLSKMMQALASQVEFFKDGNIEEAANKIGEMIRKH